MVLLGIPGWPLLGKARVRPGLVAAEVGEEEADTELGNGAGKGHPKPGYTSGKEGFALQGACECGV